MATRKNNWLNAKPVTRTGGGSRGTVRNPSKPYNKPGAKPAAKPAAKPPTGRRSRVNGRVVSGTDKRGNRPSTPQRPSSNTAATPTSRSTAPASNTRPGGGVTMPNSRRAGVNLPQTGARAERTATRANQLIKDARANPASAPKPSPASGAASTATKAAGGLKGAMGRLGRLAGPIGIGMTGADLAERAGYARGGSNYREFTRAQDKPPAKPIKQGNAQSRFAGARDANLTRINNDPRFAAPKPAAKPEPRPAPTQSGGGSTQSRSGGGGSSRPTPRSSGPAADAGMKNQDKNYRGNLFEKTFGYKPGQAPDQIKSRFKSVDNKFGQDSGYEPTTKVDGSKYADKKPDMKKVKEYDRLRRKYYD